MLLFLLPSMLVAPHLELPRPWLTADTAPAAVVAAAAFFLTAIWPFWPALAGPWPEHITGRWTGRTVLEGVMLIALAAPFALVAWSVGGRALDFGPPLAAVAGLVVLGLFVRAATVGLRPAGVRWLVFAAWLLAAGPLIVAYAVTETVGAGAAPPTSVSPVAAAVGLALEGWSETSWVKAAVAVLALVGACRLIGTLRCRAARA